LALGGQAVHQQGVVDALALGAMAARIGLQRGQLVVEQALAFVQQAADQGALAVVHAAAGDEAQQRLGLVRLQVGADVGGGDGVGSIAVHGAVHQKYPSSFFFSIEAVGSWSITRPWRSELVATSISAMMSSRVSACDSIAPVSG